MTTFWTGWKFRAALVCLLVYTLPCPFLAEENSFSNKTTNSVNSELKSTFLHGKEDELDRNELHIRHLERGDLILKTEVPAADYPSNVLSKIDPDYLKTNGTGSKAVSLLTSCHKDSLEYLRRIDNKTFPEHRNHVPYYTLPPEPNVICPKAKQFKRSKNSKEDTSGFSPFSPETAKKKVLFAINSSDWLFSAFKRKGWTMNYVPDGERNAITPGCYKKRYSTPPTLHQFLKGDLTYRDVSIVLSHRNPDIDPCYVELAKVLQDPILKPWSRQLDDTVLGQKTEIVHIFDRYEKFVNNKSCFATSKWIPKTYSFTYPPSCRQFFVDVLAEEKAGTLGRWFHKDAKVHAGEGVIVLNSDILAALREEYDNGNKCDRSRSIVVQQVIHKLLRVANNDNFLRTYMFSIYHNGHVQTYLPPFGVAKLVGKEVLHSGKTIGEARHDVGWDRYSWDEFERVGYESELVDKPDWFETLIVPQMMEAMAHMSHIQYLFGDIPERTYFFGGLDFIITEKFEAKFIEINALPGLHAPLRLGRVKILDTIVDIMEQVMIEGAKDSSEINSYDFRLIYDSALSGSDQFGNHANDACFEEEHTINV